jgi:hypothetical protein
VSRASSQFRSLKHRKTDLLEGAQRSEIILLNVGNPRLDGRIGEDDLIIGVLSTHCRDPIRPAEAQLKRIDAIAAQAAVLLGATASPDRTKEPS